MDTIDNNNNNNNIITNTIDDEFWLKYSKDGISKNLESKEKAAARLDTLLISIWGVYTSIFALANLFNFVSSNIWQLIWISQPILIVMLAKLLCTLVLIPRCDNQDIAYINDVASIIESYKKMISNAKRELKMAIWATLISIISVIVAIVGYNQCDPNKKIKEELQTLKIEKEIIANKQEINTIKIEINTTTNTQKN